VLLSALFFCKIKLNIYFLQKTALLWLFLQKSHNYVTAQRIFNQFCQNQITVSWHIHLRIFTESFVKFVQKLWEIYGKNKYITFFLNTVYINGCICCHSANKPAVHWQWILYIGNGYVLSKYISAWFSALFLPCCSYIALVLRWASCLSNAWIVKNERNFCPSAHITISYERYMHLVFW